MPLTGAQKRAADHARAVLIHPAADTVLRAELHEVEHRHPGWHAFLSDERRSWAVHVHRADGTGCGVTLDAGSPQLLDSVIIAWEHTHLAAS